MVESKTMTPQDEQLISNWNAKLEENIQIELVFSQDKRSEILTAFCEKLELFAPGVTVIRHKEDEIKMPAIKVKSNLLFHMVPSGKKLETFLETLVPQKPLITAVSESRFEKIKVPAFLNLYITDQCPHCPVTISKLIPLVYETGLIRLSIIDGTLFHETAQENHIQSVPTLMLNRNFRWTGSVVLEEVVSCVINQDPAHLSTESVKNLLQSGDAATVGKILLEAKEIFSWFIDLLTDEKWPVRLGAMVVMEEIIEKDIPLAGQCVNLLWEKFLDAEDPVKGDILYICGESGDSAMIRKLQTVLDGPYSDDIKEAAKEAVETIKHPDNMPS